MKLNMFYFVQSFSITKILLDNGGSCTSSSYLSHWVEFVEIYSQVTIFLSCKFTSRNANLYGDLSSNDLLSIPIIH